MNKNMVRRIKMGEMVLESLKTCVDHTKSKGTRQRDKFIAYKSLKQVVAGKLSVHYGVRLSLTKACGIRKHPQTKQDWWKSTSRKTRKDSLPQTIKDDISSFFLSGEVSRENPGKKYVLEVNGCKVQRHTMTMTLKDAFQAFKDKYPNYKVGFTSFRKCKPIQVSKVSETNRRTCLCMQCCNLALKCESLKKITSLSSEQPATTKKDDLARMTLCGNEPTQACSKRTCEECSDVTKVITTNFENLLKETEANVEWAKWEYINFQKDDKVKRIVSCVPRKTTVKVVIEDLISDLKSYPAHI